MIHNNYTIYNNTGAPRWTLDPRAHLSETRCYTLLYHCILYSTLLYYTILYHTIM